MPDKTMISYELAKKLKEAGFPQKDYRLECRDLPNGTAPIMFYPTLSELIEACGSKFGALLVGPGILWTASGNGLEVHAGNPEEAVANLWLELNKKQ